MLMGIHLLLIYLHRTLNKFNFIILKQTPLDDDDDDDDDDHHHRSV